MGIDHLVLPSLFACGSAIGFSATGASTEPLPANPVPDLFRNAAMHESALGTKRHKADIPVALNNIRFRG
jgi:hypothetical protein